MNKKWITILGMHRSGTSMMSKILIDSGVPMAIGKMWIHFEDGAAYRINEKIIRKNGYKWHNCLLNLKPDEEDIKKIREHMTKRLRSGHSVCGFKEPRLSILYDHWEPYIPCEKFILYMYRDIEGVAQSLKVRDGFNFEYSKKIWERYNEGCHQVMARYDKKHIIGVDYKSILYDKKYREQKKIRLTRLLGIPINMSHIDIKMDHSKGNI